MYFTKLGITKPCAYQVRLGKIKARGKEGKMYRRIGRRPRPLTVWVGTRRVIEWRSVFWILKLAIVGIFLAWLLLGRPMPTSAQTIPDQLIRKPVDIVREVSYTDYRFGSQLVRLLTGANLFRAGPDIYSPADGVVDHIFVDGPATLEGKWTCQYARLLEEDIQGPSGMAFEIIEKAKEEIEQEKTVEERDKIGRVFREEVFSLCSLKYLLNVPAGRHEILVPFEATSFGLWPLPTSRWRTTLGVPEIRHGVRMVGSDASDFVASSYRSYTGSPWYYWQFLTSDSDTKFIVRMWETSGDGETHRTTPFEARLTTVPDVAELGRGMLWPSYREQSLLFRGCETKVRMSRSGQKFLRQGTCGPGAKLAQVAATAGQVVSHKATQLSEQTSVEVFSERDGYLTIKFVEKNLVSFRPGLLVRLEFQFPKTEGLELSLNGEVSHFWNVDGWRVGQGPAQLGPNSPFSSLLEIHRLVIEQDGGKVDYQEGAKERKEVVPLG